MILISIVNYNIFLHNSQSNNVNCKKLFNHIPMPFLDIKFKNKGLFVIYFVLKFVT